jgi:negative regulator of sigma E activity
MSHDYRQLMQEKLDGELDPQREEELLYRLQHDTQAAEEQAQLEQVHEVLRTAPSMRAPSRLAATIMAKLAKSIEAQAQLEPMPEEVKLALMLTTSIVQMAMMPMMIAASYLVMNAAYNPAILSRVMERTIALLVMMIKGLVIMLEEIERMIEKDPEMAPVAMSLIPVALMGMIEYIQEETENIANGAA